MKPTDSNPASKAVRCDAWMSGTVGQTPNRPTAAGRWVVNIEGEEQVMNVIDIDENRAHLFAIDGNRLVRSVEWFTEVGGVEWVRPEAFTVPLIAKLSDCGRKP